MSRATVLARGRVAAEAGMVDACIIRRVTGESTDPGSGVITPIYGDPPVYSGKCRVQQAEAQAGEQDAGQAHALMLRLAVHLPMSVTSLQAEDEITITASAHDADLVGRVFLVKSLAHKTYATARRVGVEERTS